MPDCLVSFGSNLGDGRQLLQQTKDRLQQDSTIRDLIVSEPFETSPVGGPAGQSTYVNAVFRLHTSASVVEMHSLIMDLEQQLGRRRRVRWDSRTVDLDLLLFGDGDFQSPELVVPHPRMTFRRFVLEPAFQVAPDWRHPLVRLTIAELLDVLDRAPNTILVVGQLPIETQQIILQPNPQFTIRVSGADPDSRPVEPQDWVVRILPDVDQLPDDALQAKLVIVLDSNFDADRSIAFRGPQLRLNHPTAKECAAEILASIQAMLPLSTMS